MEKKKYHKHGRREIGEQIEIDLAERDIAFFVQCFIHKYQSSFELRHTVCPEASHYVVSRRLKKLTRARYLDKPSEADPSRKTDNRPIVYQLTERGVTALVQAGRITPDAVRWYKALPRSNYQHDRFVAFIATSIQIGCIQTPGERFISWLEMLQHAPQATQQLPNPFTVRLKNGNYFTPDRMCGKEGPNGFSHYTIEADKDTESIRYLIRKHDDYTDFYKERAFTDLWGVHSMKTLTITTNPMHCHNLTQRLRGRPFVRPFRFKAEPAFAYGLEALDTRYDGHILTEPFYSIESDESRAVVMRKLD